MKKLMFSVATAAMVGGAFAACSDNAGCVAWDLSLKAKTLAPKKTTCKDVCGDKSTMYYLDAANRTLKGYLWACDYSCDDTSDVNVVLWDAKAKKAIVALPPYGNFDFQTAGLTFADFWAYGKKASKVTASFDITGEDATGTDAIAVTLAGINGSINSTKCGECYVKSLSGYFAGDLLPVKPGASQTVQTSFKGLCGEEDTVCGDEDLYPVYYTTLCNICGCDGFTNWCEAEDCAVELADGEKVPAMGTWSMKYNKKVSASSKTMWDLVPSYAL